MQHTPSLEITRLYRRAVVCGAMVVLACLLAGATCAPANNDTEPTFVEVEMENVAFVPKEITIKVGDTVRWTNNDPVVHTVTSGDPGDADEGALFDSGDIIQFDSFTHQFTEAGEFIYHCRRHSQTPAMVGAKVIVEE